MKLLIKISIIILLSFTACENEEYLDLESEYIELLVVQSEIRPNFYFPEVRLTRTLPLGVLYDISLSEIKDAVMYLRIDSIQIVPLHYTNNGLYKPLYDLIVIPGQTYELFGERGNQTFYASTIIPYNPQINSVVFNASGFYASANVLTNKNECYAAIWAVNDGTFITATDFFSVSVPDNILIGSTVSVRTASYPLEYQSNNYNGSRYIKVYTFDLSYEKYFLTKSGNQAINNPYVQGSGSTDWNIEGTNVIGMFIGVAESVMYPVN